VGRIGGVDVAEDHVAAGNSRSKLAR
jgi:hypothetical protein